MQCSRLTRSALVNQQQVTICAKMLGVYVCMRGSRTTGTRTQFDRRRARLKRTQLGDAAAASRGERFRGNAH